MDYRARWYDPKLGRFIQADTLVPGAGHPQALNRYAYVTNNPVKYTDPTGHQSELPPNISQERHQRLLQVRDIALDFSARTQLPLDDPNFLSDVDAMAGLFDAIVPLYRNDGNDLFSDLGIVVGGIAIEGDSLQYMENVIYGLRNGLNISTILQEVGNSAYHVIGENDPLSQYYIGYNHFRRPTDKYTGFRSDIAQAGQNQVRHFVGGLACANAFGGMGRSFQIRQENEIYDRNLYREAYLLHYRVRTGLTPLNQVGDYIRTHLTTDETE